MKKTKIVCSIGPASNQPDVMEKMVRAGMNVARINFSHATIEEREQALCISSRGKKKNWYEMWLFFGILKDQNLDVECNGKRCH